MNQMKKQTLSKSSKVKESKTTTKASGVELAKLRSLSESVGDFIRYWGFRRIHGQIWTQVFLSQTSLSGAELTKRLAVSKALISPALSELEDYGLIKMTEDGKKTKRYSAVPDVIPVIRDILKERESKIIANTKIQFDTLCKIHHNKGPNDSALKAERLDELGQMISVAQFALQFLIGQSEEEPLALWADKAQRNHDDL